MKKHIKTAMGNCCFFVSILMVLGVPYANPTLTMTQLMVMNWPLYLLMVLFAMVGMMLNGSLDN